MTTGLAALIGLALGLLTFMLRLFCLGLRKSEQNKKKASQPNLPTCQSPKTSQPLPDGTKKNAFRLLTFLAQSGLIIYCIRNKNNITSIHLQQNEFRKQKRDAAEPNRAELLRERRERPQIRCKQRRRTSSLVFERAWLSVSRVFSRRARAKSRYARNVNIESIKDHPLPTYRALPIFFWTSKSRLFAARFLVLLFRNFDWSKQWLPKLCKLCSYFVFIATFPRCSNRAAQSGWLPVSCLFWLCSR